MIMDATNVVTVPLMTMADMAIIMTTGTATGTITDTTMGTMTGTITDVIITGTDTIVMTTGVKSTNGATWRSPIIFTC